MICTNDLSPVAALPRMAGIFSTSAARRLVDRSSERDVVARIQQEAQIGEDVLVLLAIEERQAANDLERHPLADERRLERPGEGVHAD
jgi:hypothetical protein